VTTYTSLFLFCGLGGMAIGAQRARARLFGHEARFASLGGIDNDEGACRDFEYLTKSPALCADMSRLTSAELRAFAGPRAPDAVFDSAPCKSFSGLTDPRLAATTEYVDMARLYVVGVELMLSTWDTPPRLIVKENVPRILSAGAHLVAEVLDMLGQAGYATEISTHDCGELGGLGQRRRRALLVARLKRRVYAYLERPPLRPVRSCGSVLGELPLPETPSAGPMHRMPRISWLTWVRLALIPAGGDYRDLPGALDGLQKKREAWGRYRVEGWQAPSASVTGDGANGTYGVADPRLVPAWQPAGAYTNNHAIAPWDEPARTVIGATRPGSGAASVADPRVAPWFPATLGVIPWDAPAATVTGGAAPTRGAFSVADVRLGERAGRKADHCYGVLPWSAPSFTVHGKVHPGTGAYTVADPRVTEGVGPVECEPRAGAYGVLDWSEAAKTITAAGSIDNGPFAIADPRAPEVQPVAFIDNPRRPPFVFAGKKRVPVPVVILAEDGTWHRPLTPLELARLQDLPAEVDGAPLKLAGDNVGDWVERIGNAVPAGAAEAIAVQKLLTLISSDVGAGLLPSGGKVWVHYAEALQ
jgi:site-specific DNA-cytosine methylase